MAAELKQLVSYGFTNANGEFVLRVAEVVALKDAEAVDLSVNVLPEDGLEAPFLVTNVNFNPDSIPKERTYQLKAKKAEAAE